MKLLNSEKCKERKPRRISSQPLPEKRRQGITIPIFRRLQEVKYDEEI